MRAHRFNPFGSLGLCDLRSDVDSKKAALIRLRISQPQRPACGAVLCYKHAMTYRLPSLNSLRAFEAAARNLSFQAAAIELGVTSGAVSQQVRKLEHSLGVALFQRLPHGILLTAEGELYLPKITKIFDDLTLATEEIAPDMNGKKFSVGVCPKAALALPKGWPLADPGLAPYVRERIDTSDMELVRNGTVQCLIQLGSGPYEDLQAFGIGVNAAQPAQTNGLHLICKAGLADCRQTQELLTNLNAHCPA